MDNEKLAEIITKAVVRVVKDSEAGTCTHEAAHAVVAEALGVAVHRIEFTPTGGQCIHDKCGGFDTAVIAAAGALGGIFLGHKNKHGSEMSDGDIRNMAAGLAEKHEPGAMDKAMDRAKTIIFEHSDAIREVARVMQIRRIVTGEQVRETMARHFTMKHYPQKPTRKIILRMDQHGITETANPAGQSAGRKTPILYRDAPVIAVGRAN